MVADNGEKSTYMPYFLAVSLASKMRNLFTLRVLFHSASFVDKPPSEQQTYIILMYIFSIDELI
jgi:hypothetical protein